MKQDTHFANVMVLSSISYGKLLTATMTTLFRDFIFATQKQAIFDLSLNKAFQCLIFKCVFEDTFSSYETVSFHNAEIIASFPKFCNFGEISHPVPV